MEINQILDTIVVIIFVVLGCLYFGIALYDTIKDIVKKNPGHDS